MAMSAADQTVRWLLGAGALMLAAIPAAHADLVISTAPTSNVACGSGTCTATASSAVLNVAALQTMLAAGDVSVSTGSVASGLDIQAPVAWSSAHGLTLSAQNTLTVAALVSVTGTGGLTMGTTAGAEYGAISYEGTGRIAFTSTASKLTVNGNSLTLAFSIADLASAAAANANAMVALADNYDAAPDGTYRSAPIPKFSGRLDGLGNTISHLKIYDNTPRDYIGLFGTLTKGCQQCGRIEHIALQDVSIVGAPNTKVGGLAGYVVTADIVQASVSGKVHGLIEARVGGLVGEMYPRPGNRALLHPAIVLSHSDADVQGRDQTQVGGLVGQAEGQVMLSYATGAVTAGMYSSAGGLVGLELGTISQSFATGAVSTGGFQSEAGGLVGGMVAGLISDSYALGAVNVADDVHPSFVGGLAGDVGNKVIRCYSTGRVTAAGKDKKGGFVGEAPEGVVPRLPYDYWDLTTSGVSDPSAGSGFTANYPGIKGLTQRQLTSRLPAGFDTSVWGQSPGINGGRPYLLANPPPH